MAALGLLAGATSEFGEPVMDVGRGGVLAALPALLAQGLLKRLELLPRADAAFYSLETVLLMLAFMALSRIRSPEELLRTVPGEWGRLLGLDRGPHPVTVRRHVARVAHGAQTKEWIHLQSADWLTDMGECDGLLYIDGHVRPYHGKLATLPRKWASRERLCLSAMTDYWVNDAYSQPVFVIPKSITHGLLDTLRHDIVPRLRQDLPPGSKLTMVFDREAYSPAFFLDMHELGITCITYRKNVKEDWPEEVFHDQGVTYPGGRSEKMRLAQRMLTLSNGMQVSEIRRLGESGHQTALLNTDTNAVADATAGRLFNRWTQENFFKYMMEQYGIDRLVEYGSEPLPDNAKVPNPERKDLQSQRRSLQAKLDKRLPLYHQLSVRSEAGSEDAAQFLARKAALHETITQLQAQIAEVKQQLSRRPTHVPIRSLPPELRPNTLLPVRKAFCDHIKMVAYRAETAMASVLRQQVPDAASDDVRSLLQELFKADADLVPDPEHRILKVRIHPCATAARTGWLQSLCAELNASETCFPSTNLRLQFGVVT